MASATRQKQPNPNRQLIEAIESVRSEIQTLNARLFGDEKTAAPGLVNEHNKSVERITAVEQRTHTLGKDIQSTEGRILDLKVKVENLQQTVTVVEGQVRNNLDQIAGSQRAISSLKDTTSVLQKDVAEFQFTEKEVARVRWVLKNAWALISLIVLGCGGAILSHYLHWGQ